MTLKIIQNRCNLSYNSDDRPVSEHRLFLIGANKSRGARMRWSADDYDVREGAPDGRPVGRIYKMVHSPSGTPWFWALNIFPALAADGGTEATREAAMAALKARWERRRFDPPC